MNNENNHEGRVRKRFHLGVEHMMDMNENPFHFHYRLQRKFNNKKEISLSGSPNPK